VSALMVLSCGKKQRQAPHAAVGGDCNMGYRDPSRSLMVSLAWDMNQTAFDRRQCEGSRPDVSVRGIGHMWRKPF
jgi:hypothetical protein